MRKPAPVGGKHIYIYIYVCKHPIIIFFVSVFNKNPNSSQLVQDGFSIPAPRSSAHLLKSREASRHRASALASTGPVESTTVGTLRPWGSNDLGVVPEKNRNVLPPNSYLVGGWPTPLKNMKVSWGYYSQNVPNHQPVNVMWWKWWVNSRGWFTMGPGLASEPLVFLGLHSHLDSWFFLLAFLCLLG